MIVMPDIDDLVILENYYAGLCLLYNYFRDKHGFDTLSAGMSSDYNLAIKYGANIIRLGRALFD
jgi:hypothetical protein